MTNYSVIYRTGGTENAQWHKVIGTFTKEEANAKAAEIEKAGRKALVFTTRQLDAIGLPTGYSFKVKS